MSKATKRHREHAGAKNSSAKDGFYGKRVVAKAESKKSRRSVDKTATDRSMIARTLDGEVHQSEIEVEIEADGRWLAEVVEVPGAMAYGATLGEAVDDAETLAQQIVAERERSR